MREMDNEKVVLEGYALKFNKRSENLGFFDEILQENCLNETDMSNVVALYNHDQNYPLARSTVSEGIGSLTLERDNIGLKFIIEPTKTSYVNDLMQNMRAGVVNQCSFAFTIADNGDLWEYDKEHDLYHRTITNIDKLYDVSIVTTPAYADTEAVVGSRALEKVKELKHERLAKEKAKRSLFLELELMEG